MKKHKREKREKREKIERFKRYLERCIADQTINLYTKPPEVAFCCSYNVNELGYDISMQDPELKAMMAEAVREGRESFLFKGIKFTRDDNWQGKV
jgi:hypothetical protein